MTLSWRRKNGSNGDQHEAEPAPMFPAIGGLPQSFDPRVRRISEAAAGAAQYVIDLEAEVGRLNEDLGFERNHNRLLTEAKDLLRREVGALKTDNQQIREVLARTRTKLEIGAQLYVEALHELNKLGIEPEPKPAAVDTPAETEPPAAACEIPAEEPFGAPKQKQAET